MTSVHDPSLQEVIVTYAVENMVFVSEMSADPRVELILEGNSTDSVGKVDDFSEEIDDVVKEPKMEERKAKLLSPVESSGGMLLEDTDGEQVVELLTRKLDGELEREELIMEVF